VNLLKKIFNGILYLGFVLAALFFVALTEVFVIVGSGDL